MSDPSCPFARALAPCLLVAAVLALSPAVGAADPLQERARAVFGVLPAEAASETNPVTPEKIELGRKLYYDGRLSISGTISCNSCHQLDRHGVDNEPTSPGHEGVRGERNSPTVYNAAFHLAQFWDGRAADVEEQAKGPILNPVEMGMPDEASVLRVLDAIPGYGPLFAAAFPDEKDPVTYDNVARAIGAFERRLVTPSRFDAWLEGDADALTAAEKQGLETFMDTGCVSCHSGALVGGQMYQKLGVFEPFPTQDTGRQSVTGDLEEEYFFKVPSLRNVARTAPYFHDGKVATLALAIRLMGRYQLGKSLTSSEVASIEAFLNALTGEIPEAYVAKPELPADGPQMPQPGARGG